MVNGGKIDYTIGFNVDKSGLADVKAGLLELQKLTSQDLLSFNNYSGGPHKQLQQAEKELTKIKAVAGQVQTALEKAFNPTTGLMNLQQLNTSLKAIGINNISQAFARAGEAGNQAFFKISKSALTTNMQLRETNTLLDKMGTTFANTLKWGISSSIMNKFVGSVQQAYGYVQHLDTSLNDIRIVTNKSADEMDKFAVKANDAAKALGASTTDYTEAALIYYQQGLSDEESQARAETTLKAANVTGQTGQEVSEQLTAVWNGYKVTAEETELYVDKLAAVAASTAADLEELSTGMSKVASAANNMGVDIDQLNAQLATIVSVTRQAPESAGTALKTIYARMEDLTLGGSDEDGVELGKVSSTLDKVGIQVLDTSGNLRDLGEVIEEVAGKWNTWTKAQQDAIAQALAGKRQYNNLLALFDNWDMYTDALETSRNAAGTLQEQQDIYMESTAAKIKELKANWEDFYDSLINTDDINGVIDVLTDLVGGMARFLDGIGGGRNALLMLGSTATQVFSKQIAAGITNAIQSFGRMKNNAAELEAQLANIQLFKQTSQYQDYAPVKALVDSLEEVSKYYDILDNKQINQANELAKQVAEAKELEIQWTKNTEALKKFQENISANAASVSHLRNKDFDISNIEDMQSRGVALDQAKTDVEDLINEFENLNKQVEKFETKSGKILSKNESFKKFKTQIADLSEQFNTLNKQGLFDNIPKEAEKAQKALEGMQNATKGKDLAKNYKDLISALEKCGPEAQEVIEKLKQMNITANQFDVSAPMAKLQQFLQQAQMQNFINNLTSGFSALGQFASGITSLSHSFDVLGDSSLSVKEKILQVTSSIGMGVSMLVSSLVQLPKLFESFNQFPTIINSAQIALMRYTDTLGTTIEKIGAVALAEDILSDKTDDQIAALFKRAGVQKAVNADLSEEEALLVIDTALKDGDTVATNLLAGATNILSVAFATLKKIILSIHPAILLVTAAIVALGIAASASAKAQANAAKHAAEDAKAQYEASKKKVEALNEEYENVKKLVDAYKELKEQYGPNEIDQLKQHIYQLSQEYNVHLDMMALMKADYEELDSIMTQLLEDISGQKVEASLQAVNDHLAAIVADMKSIQADDSHPILDLFMKLSNLVEAIDKKVEHFVESITGVEIPDWVSELLRLPTTGFTYTPGKIAKQYNENALAQGGEEVKGVFSLNDYGQFEFDEEAFMKYTEEQQKIVLDWVEKNFSEDDSLLGTVTKAIDKTMEGVEKAIRDTTEDRQSARQEYDAAQKETAQYLYTQNYGSEGVTTVSEYNQAKDKLAEQLATELQTDKAEVLDLAAQTIEENASYKVKGSLEILNALQGATDIEGEELFSGKDLDQVGAKLDSLSDAQINFIASNTGILIGLKEQGKDVEEIFSNLDTELDAAANEEHTITIDTVLNGSKNSKDYKQAVEDLFNDESINLGMSQEEFELLDEADQKYTLIMAKRNEIETMKQKEAEGNKQIEERNAALDTEIQKYEELLAVKQQELSEENKDNMLAQADNAETFDTGLAEDVFGFEEGSEKLTEFRDKYLQAMDDISEKYKQAIADGKDDLAATKEALEGVTDPQLIDYLNAYHDKMREIGEGTEDADATIGPLLKNWKNGKKDVSKLNKEIDQYNDKLRDLKAAEEDTTDVNHNYLQDIKDTKTAIAAQNKAIDSLQSSYQSMQSIVEDYNADGKISLDNLQALVEMPTEYAAALDVENGQMSINNATMQQELDLMIQKQKNLVTDQYLTELDAIAKGQLVDATKQGIEGELKHQEAIYGTAAAAEQGYQSLLKYAQSKSKAFSVNSAAAEEATKAYYNKMQMIDNLSLSSTSELLGKQDKSSKSSSSKKEAQHEEYLERERDIYRQINEELEQIESTLGRIQKQNSYKWGKDLQKGLQQENKLLDKQLDKLKQKAKLQKADLGQRRATLEKEGIKFSKDGSTMKNAEDKIDKLYKEYNSMVDKYNSMSADQQENYKKSLDAKKKDIDKIEKSLSDYESLFSDYQSTLDEILDKHYEQIENNVEKFNNMVDVHLELDEAKKEWDDFWYEVIQDVDDTDFGGMLAKSMSKLKTLIGVGGDVQNSQIAVLTEHLNKTVDEVQAQIDSRKRGGEDSLFQDATKLSKENLEKYRDSLMEAVREAKEELDNMSDNYLKTLTSAQELIDKQIDGLESINDHLEHNVELIKLVSGEEAYEPIIQQYDKIYQNNLKMLDTQKKSKDTWAENIDKYTQLLKTTEKGTLLYKTYEKSLEESTENYKKAVSDLDKSLEKTLKDLQAKNDAQISSIRDTFDKNLSNQMGLESMEHEWNLINEDADRYLDSVEKSIELQLYANDLNDAAEATGLTAANQQRLNQFRDDELKKLREKEKLTQYDIDESRARLEILKQEMALEDQRNNKSNMRLRRDSQGNYNYQYVGDAEAEEEAEEGLLTAKKAWYDLVKKRNIETTKEIIEIRKQIVDEWNQYQKTGDEQYFKNYQMLVKQHNDLMVEAKKAATDMTDGVALYFSDVMTNDILPQNKAAAREMILMWDDKSKESFLGATEQAITDLRTVQEQFKQDTSDALKAAGVSYKEDLIEGGIDPTLDKLEDMIMTNEELDEALKEVNDSLGEQATALGEAESAYNNLKDAAVEALEEANRALEELSQTAIETKNNVIAAVQATSAAAAAQQQLQNGASSVGANNGGTGTGTNTTTSGTKYRWTMGTSNGGQKQIFIWKVGDNSKPVKSYNLTSASDPSLQQIKKQWNLIGLKSGGYTGNWNTPGVDGVGGRMAVLHQKELVLNESDTSNLLKAVSVLRNLVNVTSDFSGLADNLISSSIMWRQQMLNQSITSGTAIPQSFSTTSTNDYKNFVVNADFSGVRSADEIYQALLELENYGVQQAYSSAPIANRSY